MSSPLILGFIASFTLIAAIGAQNAFVLRQGIRREHVLPVVALCTVSDIALISAGIAGVGALISAHPSALNIAKFGGAAWSGAVFTLWRISSARSRSPVLT